MTSISSLLFHADDNAIFTHVKKNGKFLPIKFGKLKHDVERMSAYLLSVGIERTDVATLLMGYSYELMVIEFAVLTVGATLVPIDPNHTKEEVDYIFKETKPVAIFVDSSQHAALCAAVLSNFSNIKLKVSLEDIDSWSTYSAVIDLNSPVVNINNYIGDVQASDPAIICFSSGTTGKSKGCILSHQAFLHQTEDFLNSASKIFKKGTKILGVLHPSSLWFHLLLFQCVSCLAEFYCSNEENFQSDVKELSIEVLLASSGYIKNFYERMINVPGADSQERKQCLGKILGEKLLYIIAGSLQTDKRVARFFNQSGFHYLDCYGATETMITTLVPVESPKEGSIGKAINGVQFKLAEDGELLVKTRSIFSGYLNAPEKASEVFTGDWYRTGDIASIDEENYVFLKGRKKEMIFLFMGKGVFPVDIEEQLCELNCISQAFVYGEGKAYLIALLVVKPNWPPADSNLQEEVSHHIMQINQRMNPACQIKNFTILDEPFSVENGLLTQANKLKRQTIVERYFQLIESLYQ